MKLISIPLKVYNTDISIAQPYSGSQIIKIIDIRPLGSSQYVINMVALVDETRTQNCDQYVLRVGQQLSGSTIHGQPINSTNMPTILKTDNGQQYIDLPNNGGPVIVMSFCFV